MQPYFIDVGKIEDLQMIHNRDELDRIFDRAKRTIVNGESVHLIRRDYHGIPQPFERFTTLEELEEYKGRVYKYL